jgi:putative transposase
LISTKRRPSASARSTADFRPALEALLGEDAAGLSPTNIAGLTAGRKKEYTDFRQRDLSGREYVYVWVDGVHFNIRLEDDRLCTLVMIGARPDGQKELLAVEDGYRESAESWKAILRELKRRGMVAPVLAVGDGALGFWAAAREVWPEICAQGCWCHKLANVLDKLPKRLHARAKRALHAMMYAARRSDCEAARVRFEAEYQAKYPQGGESITANWERLVSFFDFPAEHCKHLRTTNVIESPFATVRLREGVTKGAGPRTKGLRMAFKLLDMAQHRWRRLDGAVLLPPVRAGVKFVDGIQKRESNATQPSGNAPREAA